MIFSRSTHNYSRLCLALLSLLVFDSRGDGHQLPRFEIGVSLAGVKLPHYRGSAGSSRYQLLLPYLVYRGENFKIDNGIEGLLPLSEDLILSISGNASIPVDEDSPERAGMPELEASLEIGPSLDYRFYRAGHSDWWLELPLRFAFTFERNSQAIGRVFHPRLAWDKPFRFKGDWKLRLAVGPIFASRQYHDYYYSVDANDALPTRPAFQATGGYSGMRVDFTYSRRFDRFWFGGFLRYDDLQGSAIEQASLVSRRSAWASGIALTWVFFQK